MKPITALLILFASLAYGQKPGITVTMKVDEFTGDTAYTTTLSKYALGPYGQISGLSFFFYKAKEEAFLCAILSTSDMGLFQPGDKIMLKQTDGNVVSLDIINNPETDVVELGNYSYSLICMVTDEQMETLARLPIEMVRISTARKNYDISPSGKKYPEACRADFETVFKAFF